MCVYFCIGFIDFMLKDKSLLKDESLLYYTNLCSSNDYKKNGKIILKYFQLLNKNVLVSKALIDSNISHDEFVLINKLL